MEPQMQEENDRHLDNNVTVEEMVQHATHSCAFVWGERKEKTSVSCNKAATAKDLMTRSSRLRKFAIRNKGKELVFVREGRAISSHWPCSLIKGEPLTVKYVKAGNKGKPIDGGSVPSPRQRSSDEIVIFQVLTRGGDGVKKILRNPALKTVFEEMTVYAYKGETVKQALRRDGRFLKTLFSKNFGLFCPSRDLETEMSMNVDDLDGQTHRITLIDKSKVPDSQPGSLDDTYISPNESQTHENQEASHQSTTSASQNNSTLKQKQTINSKTATEKIMCEIPKSAKIKSQLLLQFNESMKGKKTFPKLSRVQNLLRVEYGQNEQTCTEVRIMKKLMDLSSSVCLVSVNGSPGGTGFLLFDNFVLTNGHVIKDIYNDDRRQLDVKVTVNFSYESLDEMDRGQETGIVDVTEVAGFEFFADESGHDWALLKLSVGKEQLPDGLLEHCGFRPGSGGGICIIGHPYGGIKKIDPCSIISSDNCQEFVEKSYLENQEHVQFVTRRFFESVVQSVLQHSQKLNYNSCFSFCSSGSPVFDKYCRVVAMHSGGYTYDNARGEEQSVVEFGYHLSDILEHIIVQLVERRRFGVLRSYLTSDFPYHQDILSNVKKLVESRNLTAFKDTVRRSLSKLEHYSDDNVLKMFFAFLSQREEPAPMDMSEV